MTKHLKDWLLLLGCFAVIGAWTLVIAQSARAPIYEIDFQQSQIDTLPSDFKALSGEFAVKQEGENRFLELAPSPLNSFGVLLGPEREGGTSVRARLRSWP